MRQKKETNERKVYTTKRSLAPFYLLHAIEYVHTKKKRIQNTSTEGDRDISIERKKSFRKCVEVQLQDGREETIHARFFVFIFPLSFRGIEFPNGNK